MPNIPTYDILVLLAFINVCLARDWESVAALVCLVILKGFSLWAIQPSKKDEVAKLEERLNKLEASVRGLTLKLGFK